MNDKLCSHCGSRRSDLLQCSGCGLVHYCAPTCQKSDWKKHKRSCKPFKLETVAGKGLGLVATRPISQGDLLIREKATLMLPLNSSDKISASELVRRFQLLDERSQSALLSLHSEKSDSSNLEEKLRDILNCNGIEVTPASSVALYQTIPRINHSCSPNVVWSWVAASGGYEVKEVRAVRRVEAGEELCANYIDSFQGTLAPSLDRKQRLRKWNFDCSCQVCSLPHNELAENDKIRRTLYSYHEQIPRHMAAWRVDRAVEAAERKLALMESVREEMWTLLPSTLMELHEMRALAAALGKKHKETRELDAIVKRAYDLSVKFGDRFVFDYKQKLSEIEQECQQVAKIKK